MAVQFTLDGKYSKEQLAELATHLAAFIESQFIFTSQLPSFERVSQKTTLNDEELRLLLKDEVNQKLEARGLPTYDIKIPIQDLHPTLFKKAPEDLDPKFVLACNRLLDPSSSKSFAARMKELSVFGITTNHWNTWLKDKKNAAYAEHMFDAVFDTSVGLNAKIGLAQLVAEKDLQAIKYYHEFTGKFRPVNEQNLALATMLTVMMEIIARHVPENVIDAVAQEIESSPVGMLLQISEG